MADYTIRPAAHQHVLDRVLAAQVDASEVDVLHPLPGFQAGVEDRVVVRRRDAGIVEGDAIPYQDWALKKRTELAKSLYNDLQAHCQLPGVPRITYTPFAFQLVQTPSEIDAIYAAIEAELGPSTTQQLYSALDMLIAALAPQDAQTD